LLNAPDRVASALVASDHTGERSHINPRSTIGLIAGVLAATVLALVLAPQAQARETAKFNVLSVSGAETVTRDVVYEPSNFGSCAFSQTGRIRFHSTERATAYAFTSKAHGRARVAWSSKPTFSSNFTVVEVPGEATFSRSATYQQTNYEDPDTGETLPGCFHESSPVNCTVERTLPATLNIGGTSGSDESTYVELSVDRHELNALDDACPVGGAGGGDDPGLFSRADLFNGKLKRLSDSDRKERPVFDNPTDDMSESGTIVQELAAELKRKKLRP
jgi:hypothetical protein